MELLNSKLYVVVLTYIHTLISMYCCLRHLAWIESTNNSTLIKVVNLSTGEILLLVDNLSCGILDINIDSATGKLYWITMTGLLQSRMIDKIITIHKFEDFFPTSFTVFEVYAYVVLQQSIHRINILNPDGT